MVPTLAARVRGAVPQAHHMHIAAATEAETHSPPLPTPWSAKGRLHISFLVAFGWHCGSRERSVTQGRGRESERRERAHGVAHGAMTWRVYVRSRQSADSSRRLRVGR